MKLIWDVKNLCVCVCFNHSLGFGFYRMRIEVVLLLACWNCLFLVVNRVVLRIHVLFSPGQSN